MRGPIPPVSVKSGQRPSKLRTSSLPCFLALSLQLQRHQRKPIHRMVRPISGGDDEQATALVSGVFEADGGTVVTLREPAMGADLCPWPPWLWRLVEIPDCFRMRIEQLAT